MNLRLYILYIYKILLWLIEKIHLRTWKVTSYLIVKEEDYELRLENKSVL